MLTIESHQTIYIYTQPIDMRKSINGITLILSEEFEQNPQSGDLYLFVNKGRDKVKCLIWDKNGFVLYYKRMEKGRFNDSKHLQGDKIVVTEKQLRALLMGLDFHLLSSFPAEIYDNYF
jgi:transposase